MSQGSLRSAVEHSQAEQQQNDFRDRRTRISDCIDKCSRSLARGGDPHDTDQSGEYYAFVAHRCRTELIPLLERQTGYDVMDFRNAGDAPRWDYDVLDAFTSAPAGAFDPADPDDRGIIAGAFSSLSAIAEAEQLIRGELRNRAEAMGFSVKVGEWLQSWDTNIGSPVDAIVDEKGAVKSIYSGDTGAGKSSGANRQFEDYYRLNFQPGEDCKCLDPVDFTSGENLFYDIPTQDAKLRHVREQQGRPADFTEIDGYDPKMEVFIPLTPNLSNRRIPYDTDRDEFVPQFFTIPASEISRELIMTVLTSRVSRGQKNTLRDVYDTVERRKRDWSLKDLATEIANRDELSEKHTREAIRALRILQDMGFVRRHQDSDYTLDWDEIFRSTERITVISESLCPDETSALFVLAWVLEQIWKHRRSGVRYPRMAMRLWEMWEYAPHGRRDSDSETQSALQERIGYILTRMFRKPRDIRTHFVADSQNLMDLTKGVREMFNRYVVYDGHDSLLENIFSWTSNSRWHSFKSTITSRAGEASIVGVVGPAVRNGGWEFIGPVQMTPPSFHHHDKRDGSGWLRRVDYVDHEELRKPRDWPTDIPADLDVGTPEDYDEEEDEEAESGPSIDPKEFHRKEARNRARNGESVRAIREAIPNNPRYGKPYSTSTIHSWIEDIEPEERAPRGSE